MTTRHEKGYLGMLALLLAAALVTFLYVHTLQKAPDAVTSTVESVQPNNADGSKPKNRLEQYKADIDAAKAVQNVTDIENARLQEML